MSIQRYAIPPILQLETTTACNLSCPFCLRGRLCGSDEYLSFDAFCRIIDTTPCHYVTLHGWGEPLMHPDLVKMIRYASGKKKSVNFTTNATLLTEQTDALLDAGLDAIAFSFPDAAQFAPVISRNVTRFVQQRTEKNQKKAKTYINIALMEENFGSVEDGLALAKSVGVDVVNFERSFPWTEEHVKSEPALFMRIRSAAKKTGCKVTLPVPHTNLCPLFRLTLFVRWNGDVAPCCYRADHVLGNILQESILSILKKRAEFQKTMKTDQVCSRCRV